MIDLSYLTEEEQEMILSVLKRDSELKHKEEQRIKNLRRTEQDMHKLKYLTGEWFYETKSNRHRAKIHGSDIIRASMSCRKPVTIMELTQIWPRKSSFLKSENKDIFIPPELSGLIGDSSSSAHDNREDHYQVAEYKSSAHPQTKPRQNPFNSRPIGLESPVKTEGHLQAGVQQIPGNLHQVPADQQPKEESLLALPKPSCGPQILAEDHHEDLAEPCSSQVPEPYDSEQGKVNQLSREGQFHTLREEDESSIRKVLGWVGMMSRHSGKGNERPGVQEEQNREGPEGRGTPDTENASCTQKEIKAKPSTILRMGLPGLFLRKNIRAETSGNVLDQDEVDDVCELDDKQDNINLRCSVQNSAFGLNFTTEEANPRLSIIERKSESLYQGEGSQNRLARLVSFWEDGSKEPNVLSIKKSETNDDKVSGRKLPKVAFNLSPSKANRFEYTDVCESSKCFSESHNETRNEDNISAIPSDGEKTSLFVYKLKETYSPILSVRKAITEQDTISDLKACWEKEKSILSIPDCMPKRYSQQGLNISTSPNRVEIPETSSSSLNRELCELKASSKGKLKQSSERVLVTSSQDDTDKKFCDRSQCRTCMLGSGESVKSSPVSYPSRNLTLVSQDHSDKSTGDTKKNLEQSRTLSPRHINKVVSGDLHPVKKSRIVGGSLRAFPIDINPTRKTPLKDLEHAPRGQTRYPHGLSSAVESSPGKNGKLLTKRLSLPGNTSGRNIQYQLTSPHSPSCFGRSHASGTICMGNINSKQSSLVHSLPVSQGQSSVQLIPSPKHHRKATTKRSVEGIEDVMPVVLTEQMQLDDMQCKTARTQSSVHLSCQHHLSLADSTHVSGFSDQPDKKEWARVQMCESAEHSSPSQQFQPQSEITFDSSISTSAETWSLSWTSSACGSSEGPSPVRTAQKQASVRPISISRSLEDLAILPSKDERWKNELRSGIIQTVEEAPDSLSITVLDPELSKRLSVSVPSFMHEQGNGRESDCLSVNSFYSERQRKSSTNTNVSASSGLASMSSVSGSVTNIYGTDLGHVEVKGTIQFAINYVNTLGELHIFIAQCRDLAVAEPKRNRSDPYVKCYLLPDKAKLGKRKTSVKKKTLNPTYNEILRYKIPLESLKVHTLNTSVWHNDMFGRNSFLGEVNVDLSDWDNNTQMMDCTLKGRIATPNSPIHVNHNMNMCGDMRISLRFLLQTSQSKTPQTGEIQVWVKECTNLQSRRRTIDPFVKCSVLPDSYQKKRQKTQVVKRTANPVFNHTMVFDGLRLEDLRDTCVELTVWDHDRLSNHYVGGTRLNLGTGKIHSTVVKWMDSNAAESALWKRMIESSNEWVEETVPLRMLIMAR